MSSYSQLIKRSQPPFSDGNAVILVIKPTLQSFQVSASVSSPCKTVSQLHLQAWIKLVSSYVFHLREQNQLVWQLGAELCLKFQNSLFCSHVKKNIISPTDPCQLRSDGEESLQDATQLLRLISPQALQIRTCTALIVFPEVLFACLSQCMKHEFFRFYWQFSNRKSPRERM